MTDLLTAVLRSLGFIGLAQGAGIALFVAVFGDRLEHSRRAARRLGAGSALLAIACLAAYLASQAGRMAGELSGVLDPSLQAAALRSSGGAAFALQALGLSAVAAGLRARAERSDLARVCAVVGATLAIASFTLTGHTSVHPERGLLCVLLAVHVLIVVFWFGALAPLYLASRRESLATTAAVVRAFSTVAVRLVPCILLAGLGLAAILLPGFAALAQPYGELLLAKLGGFALLMGFAAWNRWRLGPAIGRDARALRAFQCSLAAEYLLIAAVLSVTAVMTLLFSPE